MRIGEATNERDLLTAVEQARTRRLDLRRGIETVWWNNLALLAGDHYAEWNPTMSKFEDRDPNWGNEVTAKKPRLVVNHALTIARTELAKLTKSHPIMDVLASSDESGDIAAAKVSRAVLDALEWKFQLRKLRKRALWWMLPTGLGAVYVGWDYLNNDAGEIEYVIDPNTNEPVFLKSRVEELESLLDKGEIDDLKRETYAMGDLEYKVYSPFQLLPDETCLDFDDLYDLITTEIADVDVIKGLYGRAARDVRPDSGAALGVMEQRTLARVGVMGGSPGGADTVENGVLVHTFWLTPNVYQGNKLLVRGKYLRWCNNSILLDKSDEFPFTDGRMPFAFIQHIPSATSIWPDSVLTHVRGANLEIDKTISQLIENKDYMANPMWRIATQHKIKGAIKNVAGGIVRYRHVPNIPPPEPIQGLQMPAQVENLLVGLRNQILDISGQSEVSRGRVPTGVRSGVQVAYLQEEDDTKLAPTVENFEESVALMGSLSLSRIAQFYTIPRTLRYYRRDGLFDVVRFKGADLKNSTDVICQAGSAMPKSKAARQQYVLELAQMGLIRDPHKLEQMLELGQGEPDDLDKAIAQANRENQMMLRGKVAAQYKTAEDAQPEDEEVTSPVAVPVKSWHNHQVHIARHTSVMMDEDFDRLSISNPEIVRLFDEHIAMHQQELMKQQMAEMQMLAAKKGAPDGPPGQSAPSKSQGSPADQAAGAESQGEAPPMM